MLDKIAKRSRKPEIHAELDRPQGPYYPGDLVRVTVTVSSEKSSVLPDVHAQMVGPDHLGPSTLVVQGKDVPADFNASYEAQFVLPLYPVPPSKDHLFCSWRVLLDYGELELPVPLVVPPPGMWVDSAEWEHEDRHGVTLHDPEKWFDALTSFKPEAPVRLWLPRLEWIEGETVEGKLMVRPKKDLTLKHLELSLVRDRRWTEFGGFRLMDNWKGPFESEKVEWDSEKDDSTTLLDHPVVFQAGKATEFPFSLHLARRGWPTLQMDEFDRRERGTTRIFVTGKADRSRDNIRLTRSIYVYNGSGKRVTQHLQDASDKLLAEESVVQFYKNTMCEWYSWDHKRKTSFATAKNPLTDTNVPLSFKEVANKTLDHFISQYRPVEGTPLYTLFTQFPLHPDEYLVDFSTTWALTSHRAVQVDQRTKSCQAVDLRDVRSVDKGLLQVKVRVASGDVVVFKKGEDLRPIPDKPLREAVRRLRADREGSPEGEIRSEDAEGLRQTAQSAQRQPLAAKQPVRVRTKRDDMKQRRTALIWLGWPIASIGVVLFLTSGAVAVMLALPQLSADSTGTLEGLIGAELCCAGPFFLGGLAALGLGLFGLLHARKLKAELDASSSDQTAGDDLHPGGIDPSS